ncbi:MAG: D-2-hydroxyacid dehydrogenase [Acidobacteriota bacterium]
MKPVTLLVLSQPTRPHLSVLDRLPQSTRIVVGDNPEMFAEAAPEADVLMNGMMPKELFQQVFLQCRNLSWVHSLSAGLENSLFPELVASPLPMTNSRGVFARSLAEWVITGCLYFDKFLPRLMAQKTASYWKAFDVEELHGKTMGIVGYGRIGQLTAERARAFGMKIIALRKRPELSKGDPNIDATYTPGQLKDLMAASDFVVCAAPLTPDTEGLINAPMIAAMKPTAVFLNVGRGAVVDEAALITALQEKRIRGAALDVFVTEPLPKESPLWSLDNVLISPHCADHTATWLNEAMEFFVANFERHVKGEPLENVVDKSAGY